MADDDSTLSCTLSTSNLHSSVNKLIPTYADCTPIVWDGNDAHIAGCLYDVGKYYRRTGLFNVYFKHHAAVK